MATIFRPQYVTDRVAEGSPGIISCTEIAAISRDAASKLLVLAEMIAEGLPVDHKDIVEIAEDLDQLAWDAESKRTEVVNFTGLARKLWRSR